MKAFQVMGVGLVLVVIGGLVQAAEVTNVVQAMEMVVTPTRTATRLADVPASIDVISAENLARSGAATLTPLFRSIGGADVQGGGVPGTRSKINMRGLATGLESKRVLVLVDGRRLSDSYQGHSDFTTLQMDNIERIEVLRGPASALYGSGAMGGVISMVSRQGTEAPVTELGAAGGSYGTSRFVLRHGAQFGDMDYFFTGSHLRTDGYLYTADGRHQNWESLNLTGNVGYRLGERSEMRLHVGDHYAEGRDDTNDRETRKDYQMLTYRADWYETREASFLFRVFRNGEKTIYDWFDRPEGVYRQELIGAEVQQSLWITERNRMTVGGEARRDAVDIKEPGNPIDKASTVTALYLQDEMHLTSWMLLTLGVRRDQSEDYSAAVSPRLGLLFKVTKAAELYASFNRAHRAPPLSDRFVRVEFRGMQFVGNPDLDPETLKAYEVGGRLRMGDRARFSAATFYNDLDDTFEFMYSPADGSFRNANVSRAEVYGFELNAEGRIIDGFNAFANYTWTDGTNREHPPQPSVEGKRLAYLAKDKVNLGLQYSTRKTDAHRLTLNYTGNRYGDAQNTLENRMDAFTTVNWSSRVAIRDNLWLTLNIENLTDEKYREFPTFLQPGRTVMAGVDLRF